HHGLFCWYDLVTTDLAASIAFYTKLLGWEVKQVDTGTHPYHMIHAGERPVGGMVQHDPGEGHPTHWLPYIFSDDLAASGEVAAQHGATILFGPQDVGPGSFTMMRDPQGAHFCMWHSKDDAPADPPKGTPGVFCWNECMTTDAAGAAEFYAKLFGWNIGTADIPVGDCEVPYHFFELNGVHHGGIMDLPDEARAHGAPPYWLSYVTVPDVDAAQARAAELGATIIMPPTDIPHTGRFSVIQDPQGGVLSLFTYAPEMLQG
ncbi:VOC family protein, partial [bacterium]|nr:VOC family protein [bacterium]